MQIEVKNYRSCRGNEGDAFSCTVYLDGKRAALVTYDGWGGEYRWDFTPSDKRMQGGPMCQKFEGYAVKVRKESGDYKEGSENAWFYISCCRDIVLGDVIAEMLEKRNLKSWA